MTPGRDQTRLKAMIMQELDAESSSTLAGLSDEDALQVIGLLIDRADDENGSELTDHALVLADELDDRGLPPDQSALLDFFRANAWACRYRLRRANHDATWEFEQPELRQQVLLLRRAAHGDGFPTLPPMRQ